MDYEQKYKEALELARGYYKANLKLNKADENLILEDIFPELAESEDERIRNILIGWVNLEPSTSFDGGFSREEIIAWLEKQVSIDKEKMLIGARKDVASSIITYLDRNTLGMCLSNMECEDLVNAVVDSDWGKVYDYMKKKLEKQGDKSQGKTAIEAIKEEKVDNANKVEPKFHEGDWLCANKLNDYARFVKIIELVDVFGKERYKVSRDYDSDLDVVELDFIENNYHLWSIQDAKEGDVLVDIYGNIGICEKHDYFDWTSYCSLGFHGGFQNFKVEHENDRTHPATKEQSDLLFSKMKEAGYMWDAEKKELKKIRQNYRKSIGNAEAVGRDEWS